ncbi:MAG: alanine--glyoxylate aminotransferase family protein [Candidatus Methanomethylicaceae archaeon]
MDIPQLIMLPGPTNIHPRVYSAMCKPMINHRSKEFRELYMRILENIKKIFQTENDIFILTSSGTGGVECAVSNLFLPSDKVIMPIAGTFGERFSETLSVYKINTIRINIEPGKAPRLEQIEEVIRKNPDAKGIVIVYNETSTGTTVRDLPKICKIAKDFGLITVVDAISILGGDDLPVDEWEIDFCITASQKCLATPPGLAIVSVSKDAWKMIEREKPRSDYFDLIKYKKYRDEQKETPFTPAINLFYALDEAINIILEYGLDKWINRHKITSKAYYTAITTMGLPLLAEEWCRSNTVIAVKMPNGISAKLLREILANKYRVVVAGGFGGLKNSIFRIGNMGLINPRDVLTTLSSIESAFFELGYPIKSGIESAIPILKNLD